MKKKWLSFLSLLLIFSLALAGCSGSKSTSGTSTNGTKDQKLEIFSWWTGAGEEDGLKALLKVFQKKYPNIQIVNSAVAGGAGTNAKAVLASRMQGNDPPSTFQVHGGAELNASWVAAGKMEPLNDFYKQEGLTDKFPKSLIDLVSKDGNIYAVPVDIHRGNMLWYNKKIFDENGITPPKTFDEFFAAADKLKQKGITPLALGDKEPWAATMLFENILVGTIGPDNYKKLWTGEIPLNDPGVVKAANTFKKMLSYVNDDHSSRNWQDAAQMVGKGQAAMNVMGDWAKGYFVNDLKLKANTDFGYITTPGTENDFVVITDTFGLPKGVKNVADVKKFLSVLGSVEGQDAFNPLKGSIPARIDADRTKYDEYGNKTMDDFKKAQLVPSLAHGSAAPEGFLTKVNQAVNIFVTQKDVNQFIDALTAASPDLKTK